MVGSEKHFNKYNTGNESFFTPGRQLACIAAARPNDPAIIYVSAQNKETVMTWGRLEKLSNQIAWYLLDQGIEQGKSVIAALPNIPTHIALAFGIWKAGGCYVPVSPRTPLRNMAEICDCVLPYLIVTNGNAPKSYKRLSSAELREVAARYPESMPPDRLAVPNLANLSGGTTGKVKVIQQNMPAGESDEGLQAWFMISGMSFDKRQLLAGPLFHGAPHTAAFNGLYAGNTIVMPAHLDAETVVRLVKQYQVEYIQMVPTLMQRIIKLPNFRKEDFASVKAMSHTGGACARDLKEQWLQIVEPENLYEIYSMTECIGMTYIRGDEWLRHTGSVGRMLGGTIEVRDEDGSPLPPGEIGEIFMQWGGNAPKVAYKNVPNLAEDERGFKSVGDMGCLDEEGYLYFADRRSDMIVTGGENVFAAEVENVLKKHKSVVDAVVVGLPDQEWGHRIHAVVEVNEEVSAKALLRFALDYLPPYKMPKSFEFVTCIPRNESGKIVRTKLIEESIKKGY